MLLVVACVTLGLLLGGLYLLLAPKKYVAVSSLLVERIGGASNVDSIEGQLDVIRSTEVLRLADRNGAFTELASFAGVKDPVLVIKRDLNVDVAPGHKLINVSYASTNRSDAIKVVDLVVDAYRTYQSDERQRRAKDLAAAAETSRTKIDAQLAEARDALDKFDAAHGTSVGDTSKSRADSLAAALTTAQLDVFTARRAYDDAVANAGSALTGLDEKQLENALRESAANAPESVEMIAQEVNALDRQLGELRKMYAENHPSVIRATQRLQQLRLTQVAGARQRWLASQAREEAMKKSFDGIQKDVAAANAKSSERAALAAVVDRYKTQSDELTRQINQVLLETASGSLSIRVDAPAEIDNPGFPPLPRVTPTLTTTGLIGLVIGGLFALIGEFRHAGSLRHVTGGRAAAPTATDAGKTLGMTVLGEIPEADPELDSPAAIALAAQEDPFGTLGNAVRSMRVAMEVEGKLPATILLTAAADKQGVTSLAANLAATIARENRKVLLVDANFAAPKIAALFGVSDEKGFAELLAGGDPIDLISSTAVPRLDVLPAGHASEQSSSQLNSDQFMTLVTMMSSAYDHVIFDAPSLARGDDARIVASICDGTILVARQSLASLKRAAGARDLLLTIGANLLGVALNRSTPDGNALSLDTSRVVSRSDTSDHSSDHGKGN